MRRHRISRKRRVEVWIKGMLWWQAETDLTREAIRANVAKRVGVPADDVTVRDA